MKRNASSIHILKQDPMETFRQLSGALLTDSIILGCTKGAAAFVLGELAREQGGKMEIFGEHRCPDYLVTWGIRTSKNATDVDLTAQGVHCSRVAGDFLFS